MYLIRDKIVGPQGFDLLKLTKRIIDIVYKASDPTWTLVKIRGYGQTICELEDEIILCNDEVKINSNKLLKILEDKNQWFYDLECVDVNLKLKFGIIDSGFLFLEGDFEGLKIVLSAFKDVTHHI